jgi:DNA-binding IclR family transcriptional regulator
MNKPGQPKSRVTSLDKALSILELIVQEGKNMPLMEISRKSGLGKGTVHRILATLRARGYVQQDPENREYVFGFRLFDMASRLEEKQFLQGVLLPTIKEMWLQCDETVGASVLEGNHAKNILRLISRQPLRISLQQGARFPAHCTAAGKALLSLLTEDRLRQIYETHEPLARATEHSIQSFEALLEELKKVRDNNVAYGDEEAITGVYAIGAPILNIPGRTHVALSIAGPKERMKKNLNEVTELIVRAADRISQGFINNRKQE